MAKFDIYQYPTDTLLQQPDYLQDVHNFYEDQLPNWMYYIRSYMGGEEYKGGRFLQEYNLELEGEYENRINNTYIQVSYLEHHLQGNMEASMKNLI